MKQSLAHLIVTKGHLHWDGYLKHHPSEHLTLQCPNLNWQVLTGKGQEASHVSDGWILLLMIMQNSACNLSRPGNLPETDDDGISSCWMLAAHKYGKSNDYDDVLIL